MNSHGEVNLNNVANLLLDGGFKEEEAHVMLGTAVIQQALERCRGNICHAARLLGIHRNTLTRRMARFGLSESPISIRQFHKSQTKLPLRFAA